MPGTGGAPGATQPARPLDPATIAAIVDALAVNGSGRARKTIREVLAGTFVSDSDRAAAEAALVCLLTYPSPESEDLFLTILVSPEKIRPNPAGQNPSAGGVSTGYSGTGSMPSGYSGTGSMPSGYSGTGSMPSGYSGTGSMPSGYSGTGSMPSGYGSSGYGSSGYGGGGQGKWTSAELQAKAVELFDRVASEAFRLAVAKRLVDPRTPALARGLLSRSLLGPSPRNVAAQVLLHGSPTIDREAKAALERQFTKSSSDALARMMNVPFQATLVPSGGRGAGSGYPGASGMPPGYSGASGMPPGYSGASGMPPGYSRPGGPSGAYSGGTAPSRGTRDDDDDRRAPMGYQAYPGAGGASMMAAPGADGMPGAALGLALGGPGGKGPLGADADLSFRVAQQLWGKQLTASIEAQLGQIESLPQGASGVLLASTVPADAVRAKLYQALRRSWDEGPRALEDAGLGTSLFSDPGFLVVMKALPRKDAPAQAAPVRIHRSRRGGTGGQGGPDAPGRPGGSYGPEGGGAYSGRGGPAQQPPKDADKPEYAWMGACEDLARAMCDQLMPAGRRRSTLAGGADGPSAENRPVEVPASATLTSEYRFEWPKDLSSARSKLAGVPLDPMSVYYVRMSVANTPSKVMGYYRRQLVRPVEHQADVGYWLESVRTDDETKRRVSVDVLIAKKAERDAARAVRPGGDGTGSPYGMQPGMGSPTGGSPYGPGAYGPPGSTGRGDTLPPKPDKDTTADLIVEVLVVEINNPAGTEEPAKKGKKDKRAAETDGF